MRPRSHTFVIVSWETLKSLNQNDLKMNIDGRRDAIILTE